MSASSSHRDPQERRAAIVAATQARTGVDEAMIQTLVHTFYGRIREDQLLGPIFSARISDWPPHLERMCAFWSSVMLMSGKYHGRPMPAHVRLPIGGEHFDRWLAVFAVTAHDVCPREAADLFIAKARMIASSLELGTAMFRGYQLRAGERLAMPDGPAPPPEPPEPEH